MRRSKHRNVVEKIEMLEEKLREKNGLADRLSRLEGKSWELQEMEEVSVGSFSATLVSSENFIERK